MDGNLRTVALLHHTTQVITKGGGGRSTWHYDGPSPKKKTVCDGAGKPTNVTDYNLVITTTQVTSRNAHSLGSLAAPA
jgi:hypothetical protein